MALLTRKRVIAVKKETASGTYLAPGVTNCLLVTDLSITPQQSDVVSRELIRPYFGASEQLQSNVRVECSFSVEMAGVGSTEDADEAPNYGDCFEACGFSQESDSSIDTGTDDRYIFVPNSNDDTSISILYNIDGVQHKVKGAKGTFSMSCNIGEIPTFDFTFTGIIEDVIGDGAPLSPTYNKQATPVLFNNSNTSAFKLASMDSSTAALTLQMSNFTLDVGNEVVYRDLVGGNPSVMITNRNVTGSVTIEAVNLDSGSASHQKTTARYDPFAAALADGTLNEISFQHGQTAKNKVTMQSGKLAAKNRANFGSISYGEQDGIAMWEIPFTLVPSTAGNDELSLIFS